MSKEPTTNLLEPYLKIMVEKQAADLYFVTGAKPNMKHIGKTVPISKTSFKPGQIKKLAYSLLTEDIKKYCDEQNRIGAGRRIDRLW
jgi:twitching motility protein PilU